MTLITDVLSRAARQTSVTAPSSWLSATSDEHRELRDDFLLETVDDILERIDLPAPIGAVYNLTGDGSETYALPSQFKRLQRDRMAVYDASLDRPCIPITDDGEYTARKDVGTSGVYRYYRLTGYEGNWSISFYDEPSASITINIHYCTTYWAASSGGTAKAAFTDPDDVLLLPRRVVETGIVWRWRERKGLDFMPKMMEYEALLARLSNDRRGRRTINFGDVEPVRWQDLVPSSIPSS